MSDTETRSTLRGPGSIFPPLVLALVAGLVVWLASDYGPTARRLPMLIGIVVFCLAVLDLLSRLPGRTGQFLRLTLGAGFTERELDFEPGWRQELEQLAWLAAVVTAVAVVGLLVTIPAFVFSYTWLKSSWPVWLSALTALVVITLVGIVFEVLLDYELFRGLLFREAE